MIQESLTFDDVLLVPQYSELISRSKVDLSVDVNNFKFNHPIIPANMQTVTGADLALVNSNSGGLSILHRFMSIEDQIKIIKNLQKHLNNLGVSVGVQSSDKENIKLFIDAGVKIFCVDVAHGDSSLCIDICYWIKQNYPNVLLIAGNVATGSGARRLWQAGADIVKVGVGPGSLCTTRIETGNGIPQLTALMDVAKVKEELQNAYYQVHGEVKAYSFIADGGIKNAGDMVKALCFADMVMAGNIFAGCKEAPGETLVINGVSYKKYVGSSTHKANHIEGIAAMVPEKGNFLDILTKLLEGIQSGCSYQGANNLIELKDSPTFIKITSAGLKESHPHDIIIA
jgi:IMP dehydrogenase